MANPVWPAEIPPPVYPYDEQPEDPALRSDFEGGYVQSRPRHTRNRMRWRWRWGAMPDAIFRTYLLPFYRQTIMGGSVIFDWTHWETLQTHSVRCTSFKATKDTHGWAVEVEFEEA